MPTFVDAENHPMWPIKTAASGGTGATNASNLQNLENALSRSGSQGVWQTIQFPQGTIPLSAGITKRNFVNWVGCGTDATIFDFSIASGTALSIDGSTFNTGPIASSLARFSISKLTLKASASGNTAKGVVVLRATRAFNLLEDVQIQFFGDSGLTIGNNVAADTVSDCRFAQVEIVSCGNTVANASGLKREPTAGAQAALTFENLKVEGCGKSGTGGRGGIDWSGSNAAGLWFTGVTRIQNNFGDFEASFSGTGAYPNTLDTVSFDDLYIETDNGDRDGLRFNFCQVAISGKARIGRGGPSTASGTVSGIVMTNSDLWLATHPTIPDTYKVDVDLRSSSFLFRPVSLTRFPLRVIKDATSEDMIDGWPNGIFDGKTGTGDTVLSGRNFTVTRSATGVYAIAFKRSLPSTVNSNVQNPPIPIPNNNYTVTAVASDGSTPLLCVISNQTPTGFSIRTFKVAGTTLANAGTLAGNADQIRFTVSG
jgi:hypothetical protein